MNMLIVEDDIALNNGIALSLNGDRAIQAYSIAEAKSKLDASVDLIILGIVVIGVIGVIISAVIGACENLVLRWKKA